VYTGITAFCWESYLLHNRLFSPHSREGDARAFIYLSYPFTRPGAFFSARSYLNRFLELSFIALPDLNRPQSVALGAFLLLLGGSFAFKGYNALIKGRMLVWKGFLPFTLISPFVNHLPAAKNSLLQFKEGMWIHVLMGPLFLVLCVLCTGAGADYVGLPGTSLLNTVLTAGGKTTVLSFDPHTGYSFHINNPACQALTKVIQAGINLNQGQMLYDKPTQNLEDVTK
jgi:hypothetical protein